MDIVYFIAGVAFGYCCLIGFCILRDRIGDWWNNA